MTQKIKDSNDSNNSDKRDIAKQIGKGAIVGAICGALNVIMEIFNNNNKGVK